MEIRTLTIHGREIKIEENSSIWMPTVFGVTLAGHLADTVQDGYHVLDVGTGSGIQTLAALAFGARYVTALDLNPAALDAVRGNVTLNGHMPSLCLEAMQSDLFAVLRSTGGYEGEFDLAVCNPPTFPVEPPERGERMVVEWEHAGRDGRLLLDACLDQVPYFLRANGRLLIISTSTQRWSLTEDKLRRQWGRFRILQEVDVPLAKHYRPYFDRWRELADRTREPIVFEVDGVLHQKLTFIEATRAA